MVQRAFFCLSQNAKFPSASTQKRRIMQRKLIVEEQLKLQLEGATKVAIALDGWSALPIKSAFLAIKGYWIDKNWQWHEELLGFPVIQGGHSGINLAGIVREVLIPLGCYGKIAAVTTDNASNNSTLVREIARTANELADDTDGEFVHGAPDESTPIDGVTVQQLVSAEESIDEDSLFRFPCLAHVVQLALGDLFGKLSIRPTNDEFIKIWDEKEAKSETKKKGMTGVRLLLAKVTVCGRLAARMVTRMVAQVVAHASADKR